MALEWIENYRAQIGWVGTSLLMVPGRSDYYARFGNREYFINRDEQDQPNWVLQIFVAGHPAAIPGEVDSPDEAKAHAEEHDRNARYAEGYHYAQLRQADTVSQRTEFGNKWADQYSVEGLTIADAWQDYKSG